MRRALVLAGGGALGAFEVGAADQLITERGLWFDVITGVSIGSINASALGQAKDQDELKALVKELKDLWFAIKGNDDIYRQWYPFVPEWLNVGLTLLNNRKSLYNLAPARKLIEANVDPDRLRNSGVEVRFGYVDLVSGRYVAASNRDHPDLIGAVIASGSIPVTFPPVELPGDQQGVDGGVRNTTPLADALETLRQWPPGDEPDEVWVVIPSTKPKDALRPEFAGIELKSWLKIGDIAIKLMRDEIQVNDVKHVLEINELIKNNCSPDPKYRYVDIKLVFPDRGLGAGLNFDPETIRRNYKIGYSRAKEVEEPAKLPLS